MTISLYAASIPVFKQMLGSLSDLLHKAEAHASSKSIEPNALLQARLFPDMFALSRQVQIAAGALVLTGVIFGFLIAPAWFALAGFVGAGLTFAGVTGFCGMARLLMRAPWNRVKPASHGL